MGKVPGNGYVTHEKALLGRTLTGEVRAHGAHRYTLRAGSSAPEGLSVIARHHPSTFTIPPQPRRLLQSCQPLQRANSMPAKQTRVPAAPPAPRAALAAAPSPTPVQPEAPALQPQPEPVKPVKRVSVRTRYAYPIWVAYAGRYVRPGEVVELDEVRWLRRQIELRTFISV